MKNTRTMKGLRPVSKQTFLIAVALRENLLRQLGMKHLSLPYVFTYYEIDCAKSPVIQKILKLEFTLLRNNFHKVGRNFFITFITFNDTQRLF